MELSKTLDITPEEFFDQIEKSVLNDIERATGKQLSRAKLNGFKYKKRSRGGGKRGSGTPMDVKIKRYRYPEVYEVRFVYATGTNTICYRAFPEGDGSMRLEYSEDFVNPRQSSGLLAALQLKRYERQSRRRAEQTISGIEKLAHQERKARVSNPVLAELEAEEAAEAAAGPAATTPRADADPVGAAPEGGAAER